ncbi:hypothetical protein [Neisseria meningitidis]|uniref:hypothetical protein n=1 Tax=Neisseria meningitidis TaxID=487 RepID=UPI00214D0AD6|nr:hypothetical protein [Neisseria meningitidis]
MSVSANMIWLKRNTGGFRHDKKEKRNNKGKYNITKYAKFRKKPLKKYAGCRKKHPFSFPIGGGFF